MNRPADSKDGTFRYFFTFYCLITTFQRTPGRMLGSLIQSIERQFQIPSRISGFIVSAGDISYVSTIIILAYWGSQGNRARWIGYGGLVVAFACFVISSPGYLFSRTTGSDVSALPPEPSNLTTLLPDAKLPFAFCDNAIMELRSQLQRAKCQDNNENFGNMAAFYIVLAGVILMDVSRSLRRTLGIPLIDDQVKNKRKTPFYFGVITSVRILGSLIGILLSAVCSRLYVTFRAPPGMTPYDPHWIGAWWLGFAVVGVILIAPSMLMVFTAKTMPDRRKRRSKDAGDTPNGEALLDPPETSQDRPTLRNQIVTFLSAVIACLKSQVYTSHLISFLLRAFAWKGMSAFWSKYLENLFGMPMYQVNLIFGFVDTCFYICGVMFGSYLMRKFNLDGRRAAAFVASGSILSTALTVCLVFLSCHSVINQVGREGATRHFQYPPCQDCNCTLAPLYPVCALDGTPYYSPCHAGCSGYNRTEGTDGHVEFHSCSCVNATTTADQRVSRAFCTDDCFVPTVAYFVIFAVVEVIAGTGHVTNMLIGLRSVPEEHRSTAVAFSSFVPGLISALPSTPLYGMIFDAACILWNRKPCGGGRGACLIYDPGRLRNGIISLYVGLHAAADLCLLFILYKAKNLKLMEASDKDGYKKSAVRSE